LFVSVIHPPPRSTLFPTRRSSDLHYGPIDYQAASYYSAPKTKKPLGSLDDVDPELLKTYEKLGIPLYEAAERFLRLGRRVVAGRSEEHTSELQSRGHLVCRPLLEK